MLKKFQTWLLIKRLSIKYRLTERLSQWVANRLPRNVVYFAAIRLMAFATMGKVYGKTNPSELSVMDAINRWVFDKGYPGKDYKDSRAS